MLAYGGNGPVFAAIQAQELGIRRVLVPKASPAFSALGALAAAPAIDEEQAYLCTAAEAEPETLRKLWTELDARAEHFLGEAGFARERITSRYQLNLRYPGQNWSLTVDAAEVAGARDLSFVGPALLSTVIERFHACHEHAYGHRRGAEAPELTGVRLASWAETEKPTFGAGRRSARSEATPAGTRQANLGRGLEAIAIHRGPSLAPGNVVTAPAIIEETFTTIVVYPGWQARVDDAGDYVLEALP